MLIRRKALHITWFVLRTVSSLFLEHVQHFYSSELMNIKVYFLHFYNVYLGIYKRKATKQLIFFL